MHIYSKHLIATSVSHELWHCCARSRAQQCQQSCDTMVGIRRLEFIYIYICCFWTGCSEFHSRLFLAVVPASASSLRNTGCLTSAFGIQHNVKKLPALIKPPARKGIQTVILEANPKPNPTQESNLILNIIRDRPASTETTPTKNTLISTDLFLKHLQHLDGVFGEFHLGVISVIGVDELPQRIVGGKEEHGLGVVLWGDRSKCLELATLEGPFRPRQTTAQNKSRNKNFQ